MHELLSKSENILIHRSALGNANFKTKSSQNLNKIVHVPHMNKYMSSTFSIFEVICFSECNAHVLWFYFEIKVGKIKGRFHQLVIGLILHFVVAWHRGSPADEIVSGKLAEGHGSHSGWVLVTWRWKGMVEQDTVEMQILKAEVLIFFAFCVTSKLNSEVPQKC